MAGNTSASKIAALGVFEMVSLLIAITTNKLATPPSKHQSSNRLVGSGRLETKSE